MQWTGEQPDPLAGLEDIPWERLHHAYGIAVDVPDQIRALRSTEPEARRLALGQLSASVYHQGTRWQASSHTVGFLAALVDDVGCPDRAAVLDLLHMIGVGDRSDDVLPFHPEEAFAISDALSAEELDSAAEWLYQDEYPAGDDATVKLIDAAASRWDADAYHAVAGYADYYRRWLTDADVGVAARAAALLAWFPPTDRAVADLIAVPCTDTRDVVRASANLTLAHSTAISGEIEGSLRRMLTESAAAGRVTAAVALAYRLGQHTPDQAVDILIAAKEVDVPSAPIPGWDRPLRGFVALALQQLGLG